MDRLTAIDQSIDAAGAPSLPVQLEARPERGERVASSRRSVGTLLVLFLLTLPLVNPWVRGDGVGYYAYVRSLLVEHKLDFNNDWRAGNLSFTMGRVRPDGSINPLQYTRTGHLDNHFAVGPSMLWAPFVAPVHLALMVLKDLGADVKPDGFSRPYILAMALATAFYGFLGVFLSFRFACQFVEERWALLATVGIWLATSLPVYMYFNPSWSHAHSVFIVAVFLWYWYRTRQARTTTQWVILGLISGLVLDVYYVNVAVLVVPLLESLEGYWRSVARQPVDVTRGRTEPFPAPPQRPPHVDWPAVGRLFRANLLYCCAALAAFLPTLITRKIIYGGPFIFGYREAGGFRWSSPYLRSALLSADHGLLAWTPILILAAGGLFLFLKRDRRLAAFLIVALVTFCYIVGGDPNWDGIASFGNRFFVSLTPLFVLGLAVLFNELARWLKSRRTALVLATSVIALFILWNFAFIFQWGTHMVPARGPISWKQMVRNQFLVVPRRATTDFKAYLQNRRALMQEIEEEDVIQLTPGGGQNHQSTNDRTQGDDRNDRGPRR